MPSPARRQLLARTDRRPRKAANNIGYAIGDSRMNVYGSPAGGLNQRYPLTVARQLLMGQLHLPFGNVRSGSGQNIQTILTNFMADALASPAMTLIMLAGVNDQGGNASANIARLKAACQSWVNSHPGRVVHLFDEVPWGGTVGDEDGHVALHFGIQRLHDPAAGIYVFKSWRTITGGNDGIVPLADSYRDPVAPLVHFTIPGSVRLGIALAEHLRPTLPAFDFHGRPVAIEQVFAPGSMAANDMASFKSLTAGTITESFVTFEGETWLEIVMTGALGFVSYYRSSSTIPGDWVLNTTLYESNMDFVLLPGHSNIRMIGFGSNKQSGGGMPHFSTATSGVFDGNHSGSGDDAADQSFPDGLGLRGTFWSPRYRLAADATQLKPWTWQINSRTSLPMSGTLLVRRPQCRVIV